MEIFWIIVGLIVIVALVRSHINTIDRARLQEQEKHALEAKASQRKHEAEQQERHRNGILAAEAQRLERASGIAASDLQSIRASYTSHLDPFTLVRRGWDPSIIEELDPAEVIVVCEDGRKLPLYSASRVEDAKDDALDRSFDYVDRICFEAEREQKIIALEEEARLLGERLEQQVVVDISSIRNKATNEPPS